MSVQWSRPIEKKIGGKSIDVSFGSIDGVEWIRVGVAVDRDGEWYLTDSWKCYAVITNFTNDIHSRHLLVVYGLWHPILRYKAYSFIRQEVRNFLE